MYLVMEKKVYTFEFDSDELFIIAQALLKRACSAKEHGNHLRADIANRLGCEFRELFLNALENE